MGIGFVLFMLGFPAMVVAVGVAALSWFIQRGSAAVSSADRLIAVTFPLVVFAIGVLGFVGYGAWCVSSRHVDIGIGDFAYVPIAGPYSLCMGDGVAAYVATPPDCEHSVIESVASLATAGDRIVGATEDGRGFALTVSSGQMETFDSVTVAAAGLAPGRSLQSADAFYFQHRWGWADAAVVTAILIPAAILIAVWVRAFLRINQGATN